VTRVLHVVECYDAGVGRAVNRWIALAPRHEHHLLWEGLQSPAEVTGIASHRRMPAGLSGRTRSVGERVDAIAPDVIVAHSSWAGVYARVTRTNAPVIYVPHAYKFEDPAQPAILRAAYRWAEGILARRTSVTVALTPREEWLAHSLHRDAQTRRVPNASTLRPTSEHPATGFDADDTVAMIGRISAQKSPRYFLEVAGRVRAQRPRTRFVWAGDGDQALRRELEDAGIEVTGWLDGDALRSFLSRPFVYFHSAAYEGFPLSVLDAAAFEHPVVVRDIPPFEDLDIWQCSSPADAAAAILSVLDRTPGHTRARSGAQWLTAEMNEQIQAEAVDALLAGFDRTDRGEVPLSRQGERDAH